MPRLFPAAARRHSSSHRFQPVVRVVRDVERPEARQTFAGDFFGADKAAPVETSVAALRLGPSEHANHRLKPVATGMSPLRGCEECIVGPKPPPTLPGAET